MIYAVKTVLHVGCGQKTLASNPMFKGWREVRFDIDPAMKPDIVGTMTDLSAVESGAMDAVYTSHALDHVCAHEVEIVLREFRRVLNDSGIAFIIVPDLQKAAERIVNDGLHDVIYKSPGGEVTPLDMIYGHRRLVAESPFNLHKCGFTEKSLTADLLRHFPKVASMRDSFSSVQAIAFVKNVSLEEAARLGIRVK